MDDIASANKTVRMINEYYELDLFLIQRRKKGHVRLWSLLTWFNDMKELSLSYWIWKLNVPHHEYVPIANWIDLLIQFL